MPKGFVHSHHHGHHHNHHGHHHSHHHGLGAAIGVSLLAGAAAASIASSRSSSSRVVYVPTNPPPPTIIIAETPEQAALRIQQENEARIRKEEELKKQAEIRRERERVENEAEIIRQNNFIMHLKLINEAVTLSYDALKTRILGLAALEDPLLYRFQHSPYRGMPASAEGANLMGCVLFNSQLTPDNKVELLNHLLFNLGYNTYYLTLFNQRQLLDQSLSNPQCFSVLANLYNNTYLKSNHRSAQKGIPVETEIEVWKILLKINPQNAKIIFELLNNRDRKLQLLKLWIDTRLTATEIINTYENIKNNFKLSHESLDFFNKLSKQRILSIELNNKFNPPDRYSTDLHPGEDHERIADFLAQHRNRFSEIFCSFFMNTRSFNISREIYNGNQNSIQSWAKEQTSLNGFIKQHHLIS